MEYTRVTVIGSRRKADIVLPDDLPVDELLPEIVTLLDEPTSNGGALILTTLLGERVDGAMSFSDQEFGQGAILRLTLSDEAPQPPDVAEITEAVAAAVVRRRERWTARFTAVALAVVIGLSAATTGLLLPITQSSMLSLAALFFLSVVGGAVVARRESASGRDALFGAALGLSVPLGAQVAWLLPIPGASVPALWVAVTWAGLWLATYVVVEVGARVRGIRYGALIGVLTTVLVASTATIPLPPVVVATATGIVAALILGLAPSFALASAGLARIDDAAQEGAAGRRTDIDAAILGAFTTQTALVLALVAPVTASILVLGTSDGWGVGIATALAVFLLARSRLFPLAIARIALLFGTLLPALLWLAFATDVAVEWRIAIGAAAVIAFVLVASSRPSATAPARLRRLMSSIEMLAVLALVPLLLGLLGVFDDLLGAFS